MSLVGSLEDLGLGDILQIIHLSGKSGALVLKSDCGEAEIVFDYGLIRGAFLVGGPTTLAELLIARKAASADAIREAASDARTRSCPLGQVLADRNLVDAETIDGLQREHIEASVLEMFRWPAGEFSFEVREVQQNEDEFYATPGVNPQFIALEGTRIADETAFARSASEADPIAASDSIAASDPIAGAHIVAASVVEAEAPSAEFAPLSPLSETDLRAPDLVSELDSDSAADLDTANEIATVSSLEDEGEILEAIPLGPDSSEPAATPAEPVVPAPTATAAPVLPEASAAAPQVTPPVSMPRPAVIIIDPDLGVLEWAKAALGDNFPQVHIFQRTDLAIARIRQYLARTQVPLVVLASDVPRDPISGADGPFELLRRLRRQAARMPVAILAHEGTDLATPTDARPSVVVRKPNPSELADSRREVELTNLGTALVDELIAVASATTEPAGQEPQADIARLRETSARIREGAAHGDVLPQVLAFAAQTFSRVALFMIREDQAIGIAQAGLSRAGGPDEQGLREIHLDAREPAWFRAVLDHRAPYRGAPSDEGDQRLAVMLGNEIPSEAYLAPIQTADRVVAILYGDNLPSRTAIPETSGLEVVIDSAGIALERTLLERELAATQG